MNLILSLVLILGGFSLPAHAKASRAIDFSVFDEPLSPKELKKNKKKFLEEIQPSPIWGMLSKKEKNEIIRILDTAKTTRDLFQVHVVIAKNPAVRAAKGVEERALSKKEEEQLSTFTALMPEYIVHNVLSGLRALGANFEKEEFEAPFEAEDEESYGQKIKNWFLSWF